MSAIPPLIDATETLRPNFDKETVEKLIFENYGYTM